jgi:hypothetical protein
VISGTWSEMFGLQVVKRMMIWVLTLVMVSGTLTVWKGYVWVITGVKSKTWLSLLVTTIIWPTKSNCLTYLPHKASPLQPNRILAKYVDVYSPLLYTPTLPHPQVVSITTTAHAKMKPWKETSRSSNTTTSSRCGLAATPSRLPMKAAFIYVSFPHFDLL